MLGQDEQETDTKNRTSTNSASKLTNPLEMIKKTIQAFESLNSDVRARSWALITMLGKMSIKRTRKIRFQRIQLLSSRTS